jgi:hypothetical protein
VLDQQAFRIIQIPSDEIRQLVMPLKFHSYLVNKILAIRADTSGLEAAKFPVRGLVFAAFP